MYAALTLIASYWYRRAFEAHDNDRAPRMILTPRELACLRRAEWYDKQARDALEYVENICEEQDDYHKCYAIWHTLGLSFETLRVLCAARGVRI